MFFGGNDNEKFKKAYEDVFDISGFCKDSSKKKCQKLIMLAKKIDSKKNYGDQNSGIMNVNALRELYKRV